MSGKACLRLTCAAMMAGLLSHAAAAQSVLKLQGAFAESWLDQPPGPSRSVVVGATIVGVRLDGPDTPFNPAGLRVRLGAAPAGPNENLCLRIISRDGRYSARAQYPASAPDPAPVVEFNTAYKAALAAYSNRDVAASAFRAVKCDAPAAVHYVASQLTPALAGRTLVVQIRAGEARVRAQLAQGQTPVGDAVLCERYASGPTVGYTAQCSIKLPADAKSGQFSINIGETASSGDIKVKTYPLTLWLDG